MHGAFVVMKDGKYVRRGSYGKRDLVENPLAASLYQRKRDAEYIAAPDPWGSWSGGTVVRIEAEVDHV